MSTPKSKAFVVHKLCIKCVNLYNGAFSLSRLIEAWKTCPKLMSSQIFSLFLGCLGARKGRAHPHCGKRNLRRRSANILRLFCIRYLLWSSVSLKWSSHGMHWLQEILRRGPWGFAELERWTEGAMSARLTSLSPSLAPLSSIIMFDELTEFFHGSSQHSSKEDFCWSHI